MKTEKYISELLYRYQCVCVPSFGAFLSEWQSAQIAEGNISFVPPRKLISFNSNIKTNDGLLANHIAIQEKISYENALAKIQTQVVYWLEKLKNKETLVLENIGEIFSNSENNFVFIPYTSVNYLTDSFGLASFNSPEIKRETQPVSENISVPLQIVKEEEEEEIMEVEVEEKQAPVIALETSKPNINWIKYAAAASVFLTTATYGYKMYYDYSINQKTVLVEKTVQEKVHQKIQEATFILPNPLEAIQLTSEKETITKFHVIAGAFKNERNAKKKMNHLISKGFDAQLITKYKKSLILVTFGSFSNLSDAEILKQNIKNKESIDTWLLVY